MLSELCHQCGIKPAQCDVLIHWNRMSKDAHGYTDDVVNPAAMYTQHKKASNHHANLPL